MKSPPSSSTPWKLWPRGRLDIEWNDLMFAFWAPFLPGLCPRRVWPTIAPHLAMHSVRTAWDALLAVQQWPRGSEVIVSEANIPGMMRLIEEHDLVPVPVPLDLDTLSVDASAIEGLVSEKTRAILFSPLFGSRMNLEAIGEIARRHNLLLVEDNAQGFSDTSYRGSPSADVTLFSFGLIKTRTALSGAVVFARDEGLLRAMEQFARSYPRVSTREFYRKLVRAAGLQLLCQPYLFGALWWALRKWEVDPDVWLSNLTRGMSGTHFLKSVRRRPHRGTLKLLRRRLRSLDTGKATRRMERCRTTLHTLPCGLGGKANFAFFWALPVVVPNREKLIERARQQGFDVSFRASSVVCHGLSETPLVKALNQAVFLPIGTPMPDDEWGRLLQLVGDHCDDP